MRSTGPPENIEELIHAVQAFNLDLLDLCLDTYKVLTGACEMPGFLQNKLIGVVNRSYQDVTNFKTMVAQIKDEDEFL
jgi:hypothetical protein